MAPEHDSKGAHEPLLNGEEPGDITLEVDDLVTQGAGGFQEARDGDRIPPERSSFALHLHCRVPRCSETSMSGLA